MSKTVNRLFNSFKPETYTLEVHPNADTMTFSGTVTIVGKKTGRPSQRLTFHQHNLKITGASITRQDKSGVQEMPVDRINQHDSLHEVRLHSSAMLYAGNYTVTMQFEGKITTAMVGLYPCFFKKDGEEHTILATQFESHYARELFPCIDEPEAKAVFELSLRHKTGHVALGNTPAAGSVDNGDGTTTTTFEPSPRMSSYLLAFVTGELHSKETTTESGIAVRIWGSTAQPAESFDFALDVAKRSIEFFEDYFGVPYPLKKADHVALPDFSSGAMENWGLITYREIALLVYPDQASQSARELAATVIAHETSHQWFGNLVTMKWWDDLWLNESFANMMEYQSVDAMFPDWHIWDSFVTAEGLSATRRDATPGVQAVKTDVNHPDEINTLFDPSIVYAKGGRLLYMLKNYIGEDAFRKGLQAYFTKHKYGNTQGADLWDALSAASGKDIAAFMNPWLERSGFPVVQVDQQGTALRVEQHHFLDNQDKIDADRVWPVPLFADQPDVPALLERDSVEATLENDTPVIVNREGRGHYIVQYQQATHREYLAQQVQGGRLGEIDRLLLLSDSAMLARAGLGSFADALQLLTAYTAETTEPVWDVMSLIIGDSKRFIDADSTLDDKIKQLVRELIQTEYKRLGWEESASESPADQKLRGTILALGAYADHKAIVDEALRLFEEYKSGTHTIPAELRSIVLSVAVRHNVPGAADFLLEQYATTSNSDLQRDITGALTSTTSVEQAKELLDIIKDPKRVKPQDADRWVFFLLRNRFTKEFAWQWMEDNWQWIEDTYKQDKSYDYFPRYAAAISNTEAQQQRYIDFFQPKAHELTLKRNIEIGLEEITSRVAWLKRDLNGVQQFFKN